jgi:hypothetical protein
VFNEQSAVLVGKLSEKVGQEFDIFPYITLCTLDVICGKRSLSFYSFTSIYGFLRVNIQKRLWGVTSMPKAKVTLITSNLFTSKKLIFCFFSNFVAVSETSSIKGAVRTHVGKHTNNQLKRYLSAAFRKRKCILQHHKSKSKAPSCFVTSDFANHSFKNNINLII